jgi:hypothetical protein
MYICVHMIQPLNLLKNSGAFRARGRKFAGRKPSTFVPARWPVLLRRRRYGGDCQELRCYRSSVYCHADLSLQVIAADLIGTTEKVRY